MTASSAASDALIANLEVMEAARKYNAFLAALILAHAPASGVIIDFGAGTGTFARRLADAGRRPLCVEPDPQLRAQLAQSGFDARADLGDLPADSVDYAYTLNVLEHIEDDVAALRLLRSRLKPGGCLLIYVPAFPCLYSSMDRAVGHHRRYRRLDLIARVRAAELDVLKASYCDSLGFLASLAFKAVGRDDGRIDEAALILYDRLLFPLSRGLDGILGRAVGKNLWLLACRSR